MDRLRRGDEAAYEELVRRHGGRMLAVAQRLLGNREDAEDVLQEAFVSVFRALGSFRSHSALSSWLHRIVTNQALMRLRDRRRLRPPIGELLPEPPSAFTGLRGLHRCPPRPWPGSPEETMAREDTRRLVAESIDQLPDLLRHAVLLRDIEEMELKDIADLLGVSVNAVKIRVHRGRQALRDMLDRDMFRV